MQPTWRHCPKTEEVLNGYITNPERKRVKSPHWASKRRVFCCRHQGEMPGSGGVRVMLSMCVCMQSRSPSLRSSGRNARLWDNPFQDGIRLAVEMDAFNLSQDSWLPATDYPRASRSFPRIADSGNEIGLYDDIHIYHTYIKVHLWADAGRIRTYISKDSICNSNMQKVLFARMYKKNL